MIGVVFSTLLRALQPGDVGGDLLVVADMPEHALADADGDVVGIERARGRGRASRPSFVLLADDDRLVDVAVELLADLHLDERALLLDDDHEVEAR
jgi:hypothetical protein